MDKSTREKTYQEELEIFYEYYLPQVEKLKNETSEPSAIHCANATTYRITRKMLVEIDKLRNQNAELIVENEALRSAGYFLKMHLEEAQTPNEGEWIELEPEIGLYGCSLCDHKILRAACNFCPNCGAKMKEVKHG